MQVTQTVSEAKYTYWHSIIDIAAGSGLSREHWGQTPLRTLLRNCKEMLQKY